MTKDSTAVLHPIAFGCCCTRGNKLRMHSHLGEGFSGNWSINKCQHMCFDQRFIWVTDCYALKLILSYNGRSPAILCLQMHCMCWDMDIIHCNDNFLANANYFSRLGANLCYDPCFASISDKSMHSNYVLHCPWTCLCNQRTCHITVVPAFGVSMNPVMALTQQKIFVDVTN